MRYINGVLCILMLLFASVQYNDPDGLQWMIIYLVPALWCALAAWQPQRLTQSPLRYFFAACLVVGCALVVIFFPTTSHWWEKDVWWETETAREGMGAMIHLAVLVYAGWSARRWARAHSNDKAKIDDKGYGNASKVNESKVNENKAAVSSPLPPSVSAHVGAHSQVNSGVGS